MSKGEGASRPLGTEGPVRSGRPFLLSGEVEARGFTQIETRLTRLAPDIVGLQGTVAPPRAAAPPHAPAPPCPPPPPRPGFRHPEPRAHGVSQPSAARFALVKQGLKHAPGRPLSEIQPRRGEGRLPSLLSARHAPRRCPLHTCVLAVTCRASSEGKARRLPLGAPPASRSHHSFGARPGRRPPGVPAPRSRSEGGHGAWAACDETKEDTETRPLT